MMDPSNSLTITEIALSCVKKFDKIYTLLKSENSERRLKLQLGISPEEVKDALGKLHIWIGNVPALEQSRFILDDSLPEDIQQEILKLFQQLKSSLSNCKY